MYQVDFSKQAVKNLQRINPLYQKKILAQVKLLAISPFEMTNVKKLKGVEDTYRLRVADYRIVYRIKDNELIILIVDINHRKDIYRK